MDYYSILFIHRKIGSPIARGWHQGSTTAPVHKHVPPCLYGTPRRMTVNISVFRLCTCLYSFLLLTIHTSIHTSIHMSIHRSIRMSIRMSIDMSIHMSIRMSIDMSIHMSIHMSGTLYIFQTSVLGATANCSCRWQTIRFDPSVLDYYFHNFTTDCLAPYRQPWSLIGADGSAQNANPGIKM